MKKYLIFAFVFCIICLSVTGCSSGPSPQNPADDVTVSADVDVDLTILSSTMLAATLSGIMENPDGYIGKTIRISGNYSNFFYDIAGQWYHYVVVINDAAGCCSQGLEFKLSDNHVYPDDYPKENDLIEMVGVLNRYTESGVTYPYLAVTAISAI